METATTRPARVHPVKLAMTGEILGYEVGRGDVNNRRTDGQGDVFEGLGMFGAQDQAQAQTFADRVNDATQ